MRYIATLALTFLLAVPVVFAQEKPVKMTFSGTAANSVVNLQQPNSGGMDEDNFAGKSTLGSFTVRNIRSLPNSPTPSSSCSASNLLHFTETLGGGVVRFQDGSLLYLSLTKGSDCINITTQGGNCILTFRVTGGTGRFEKASGSLTMTEKFVAVLLDANGNAALYASTGEFAGDISGVAEQKDHDSDDQ